MRFAAKANLFCHDTTVATKPPLLKRAADAAVLLALVFYANIYGSNSCSTASKRRCLTITVDRAVMALASPSRNSGGTQKNNTKYTISNKTNTILRFGTSSTTKWHLHLSTRYLPIPLLSNLAQAHQDKQGAVVVPTVTASSHWRTNH